MDILGNPLLPPHHPQKRRNLCNHRYKVPKNQHESNFHICAVTVLLYILQQSI